MYLTKRNSHLIKMAAGINLLFLLLAVAFLFFLGRGKSENQITNKLISFAVANFICWLVNLSILLLLTRVRFHTVRSRLFLFYIPSYTVTAILALLIVHTPMVTLFDIEPLRSPISGPIFFVFSINTLCLVTIELILSRFETSNISVEHANMQAENSRLKMKSLQAEHEKLKNQLHPHFLFNSLNALKSLISRDPRLAEDYLQKLSEFLRFSISHNEHNIVSLQEELKFSQYYLDMQKIRFRDALVYSITIPETHQTAAKLPVFSLQLLLENAIKHNKLTREQPLSISIRYLEDDWLLIENNLHEKNNTGPASGIGLKNLSERYLLLTHEDIRVLRKTDVFQVSIKLIRE